MNFCMKAPGLKPFFHSSMNTSGINQNAPAVADAVDEVIKQIGPQKLISTVFDNAPVMKAAREILEKKYPHISANHYLKAKYEESRKTAKVAHTLSMPVITRWFSRYVSLNNLLESKYIIIQLVDEDYDNFKDIAPKAATAAVLATIKSGDFWDSLALLVKSIEYPSNIIGKLEADDAPLGLVYHYFGKLFEHYDGNAIIQEKVMKRLKFVLTDSMELA